MELTASEFAESFSSQPPNIRMKWLDDLVSRFNPSDWWYLRKLCLQRGPYCFDILSSLPHELSLMVLQYMPPTELCLNRRVSKKWNSLLSSESVCKQLSLHFYPREARRYDATSDSPRNEAVYRGSWKRLFEDVTSRRHFMLNGEYTLTDFSTVRYNSVPSDTVSTAEGSRTSPHGHGDDGHYDSCCFDGKLGIFSRRGSRGRRAVIYIHDLDEPMGSPMEFNVPNREDITSMIMTKILVSVISTMEVCYAWNLQTGEMKFIRYERRTSGALMLEQFVAFETTIAIIYEDRFLIWDTTTGEYRFVMRPYFEAPVQPSQISVILGPTEVISVAFNVVTLIARTPYLHSSSAKEDRSSHTSLDFTEDLMRAGLIHDKVALGRAYITGNQLIRLFSDCDGVVSISLDTTTLEHTIRHHPILTEDIEDVLDGKAMIRYIPLSGLDLTYCIQGNGYGTQYRFLLKRTDDDVDEYIYHMLQADYVTFPASEAPGYFDDRHFVIYGSEGRIVGVMSFRGIHEAEYFDGATSSSISRNFFADCVITVPFPERLVSPFQTGQFSRWLFPSHDHRRVRW